MWVGRFMCGWAGLCVGVFASSKLVKIIESKLCECGLSVEPLGRCFLSWF